MKKRIIILLLTLSMLISTSACNSILKNKTGDASDNINNVNESKKSPTEEGSNELLDIIGNRLKVSDHDDFSIYYIEDGSVYIYIKTWDVHRKITENTYFLSNFSLISCRVGEETAEIVTCDAGKRTATLTTYNFSKTNEKTESYSVTIETDGFGDSDNCAINLYSEGKGYYFYIPEVIIDNDNSWPLLCYETTDGGKSWNKISEALVCSTDYHERPQTLTFASNEIGIISYRYSGMEDLCGRTYLTMDSGKSWSIISRLQYPFDPETVRYTEVYDLKDDGYNGYVLTVRVALKNEQEFMTYIQYYSKDLLNWEIV
jgi:hypothetical protein